MKRWQFLVLVTLALVLMVATPLTALAQSEKPAADNRPMLEGALAIIAPWISLVDEEVQMTVFLRGNQQPFPDAGVWALTQEEAEALRQEIGKMKEDSQAAIEQDYEAMLKPRGIFLGRSGNDGKVFYTFEQPGRYVLVAAKRGYLPGFTHIGIREPINALGIEAPRRVQPDEQFTLIVFQRGTQEPIEGAHVWAIGKDNIEALRAEAQTLKEDTSITAAEKDYEAVVEVYGFLIGQTDENGKLDYAFKEAGGYLLIAVKMGYIPGFVPIAVIAKPKALGIRATPPQAHVGKEVTLDVFDREASDAIEGAGIWAVSRDKVEALKMDSAALREDKSLAPDEKDYAALVSIHGTFLGKTDADGKLIVTFSEPGGYLLVAVKRGYIPGFVAFGVKDSPQPQPSVSARPANPNSNQNNRNNQTED